MFCVKTVKFYLYPQECTQLSKTSIFYALIFKLLFFSFSSLSLFFSVGTLTSKLIFETKIQTFNFLSEHLQCDFLFV